MSSCLTHLQQQLPLRYHAGLGPAAPLHGAGQQLVLQRHCSDSELKSASDMGSLHGALAGSPLRHRGNTLSHDINDSEASGPPNHTTDYREGQSSVFVGIGLKHVSTFMKETEGFV